MFASGCKLSRPLKLCKTIIPLIGVSSQIPNPHKVISDKTFGTAKRKLAHFQAIPPETNVEQVEVLIIQFDGLKLVTEFMHTIQI